MHTVSLNTAVLASTRRKQMQPDCPAPVLQCMPCEVLPLSEKEFNDRLRSVAGFPEANGSRAGRAPQKAAPLISPMPDEM